MGQRSAPAPFLTKTYELVDDESVDDVVSWSETGATFVVWKTADFARDLLPVYFKHNNFSSFVRQLNTYGFRKIATDKWEFANDYFRRGQKELLTGIRRRKAAVTPQAPNTAAGKKNGEVPSPSNSGENVGSTSASSPDSKNPGSVGTVNTDQYADLSGENEKLRKDNESLSSELALAKSRCDELIGFLTEYLKVEPDQINRIVRQGSCGSSRDGDRDGGGCGSGESVKLFGVWVGEKEKKRGRGEWDQKEKMEYHGPHKEAKLTVDFHCGPLMKSSKVCNI